MSNVLLSKSLIENSDSSAIRDPFQIARNKFENQQTLSESAMEAPAASGPMFGSSSPQQVQAFNSSGLADIMRKAGIDDKGLALNDMGRFQLIGRLKQKFGDQFQQNAQALDVLKAFNDQFVGMDNPQSMTEAVSGADRTLKAILGG